MAAAAGAAADCRPLVEILELEPMEFIRFSLRNTSIPMANTLRRVMQAEVPILAIDMVNLERNLSVLPDEMLVHRLGLIPLTSSVAKDMEYVRNCPCDGACDRCTVELTLDVRCPPDVNRMLVTNRHLKSSNPNVQPVDYGSFVPSGLDPDQYGGIVICKLTKGHEIVARCLVRKGIGKEHAKFIPTCTVAMAYMPDIRINPDVADLMTGDQKHEWVNSCPKKVYKYEPKTGLVDVERADECIFCMECTIKAEDMGCDSLASVKFKRSPNGTHNFVFNVETTGALAADEIVLRAIATTRRKVLAMKAELTKLMAVEDEEMAEEPAEGPEPLV